MGGGASTLYLSNSNGEYHFVAPSNTPLTLTVKREHYGNYSPVFVYEITPQSGGSVVTKDISLPCMDYVSGIIVNTCGTVIAAKIWLEYIENGVPKQTKPEMVTAQDGRFKYRIPSIKGQATLFAESLSSGERVSRTLTLDGTEQSVTFELCMELSGIIITATSAQGNGFNMAIPNEGFRISIGASPFNFPRHDVNISLGGRYSGENYSDEYLCSLSWNDYIEGTTKYTSEPETMWAYAGFWLNEGTSPYGGDYVIDAYGVQFEIIKREGFTFRISFEADGTYWIPGGGTAGEFPVHIEGIIDTQLDVYNYSWLDMATYANFVSTATYQMNNWEGYLHEPDPEWGEDWDPYRDPAPVFDLTLIPELPVPFDEVFTSCGDRTSEFFTLCWKNSNRATFDDIVHRFQTAGFAVDNIYEGEIGYPGRPFFSTSGIKGDAYFVIEFDPEGGKLLPDYETNYGRPYSSEVGSGFYIILDLKQNPWRK
jgi:hypothetical protein